jgi:putative tryptophan/tyrosine transport system substrate-binding protein
MKRRDFISLFVAATGGWICTDTFAVETPPMARIGILGARPPPMEDGIYVMTTTLKAVLRALGWRDGENLRIEERYGNGNAASLRRLATELVELRPDVLIAISSAETKALQAATSEIPIVFIMSSDPVAMGIVDSIARPGRNTTGISIGPQILWGKRLELIVELIGHQPAKVAWLGNPENAATDLNLAAVLQSAEKMGIKLERLEAREQGDLDHVFAAATVSDAILVQYDSLTFAYRQQVAELAARYRLPAIYDNYAYVEAGGLISYGTDIRDNFRRGASYVDRILRGARPTDLPVEQASRFELEINLNAAMALGLTVPPAILLRADKVIE